MKTKIDKYIEKVLGEFVIEDREIGEGYIAPVLHYKKGVIENNDELRENLEQALRETAEAVVVEMKLKKVDYISHLMQESERKVKPNSYDMGYEDGYNSARSDLNKKGKV